MLKVTTAQREYFNEATQEFIDIPSVELTLEHSLISVSKWESKWKKSFLNTDKLSDDEMADYVRCMTVGKEAEWNVYRYLSPKAIRQIQQYMDDAMTATTFSDRKQYKHKKEIVTAELIYYWMIEAGIPFECEKWHLNRLLALIRVCNIKGTAGKKMSKRDIMKQNAELNAARRKASGSKG